ncbi:TlpA family protein disulfide reductase [Candidatus Uhrbacteria bacterium]|nr:TlpA family protein disulfide reductase [Candidatus Uhrbacteria bacterium]
MNNGLAMIGGGVLAVIFAIGIISALSAQQPSTASKRSVDTVENAISSIGDTSFTTVDGKTISLADYRGKKPVILDFFATWCPNCRRNAPHLSELYKKYTDKIEVIGINLQEDPSVVRKFASDYSLAFPIALDPSGDVARQFDVRYTNMHVLIAVDGAIIRTIPGDIQESDIRSLIQ